MLIEFRKNVFKREANCNVWLWQSSHSILTIVRLIPSISIFSFVNTSFKEFPKFLTVKFKGQNSFQSNFMCSTTSQVTVICRFQLIELKHREYIKVTRICFYPNGDIRSSVKVRIRICIWIHIAWSYIFDFHIWFLRYIYM